MANTTNELPETTDQKLDNLTMTVNGIWAYLQQEMPAIKNSVIEVEQKLTQRMDTMEQKLTQRMDLLELDSRERYVDLRKRIERLDENIDMFVEQIVDYKKRVRAVEREIAETRLLKS